MRRAATYIVSDCQSLYSDIMSEIIELEKDYYILDTGKIVVRRIALNFTS
jgi:hypothetical protein